MGPQSGLDAMGIEPRPAMLLTELHRLIDLPRTVDREAVHMPQCEAAPKWVPQQLRTLLVSQLMIQFCVSGRLLFSS
jgi:hypothetical protein